MKVQFDYQIFDWQKFGGISRYYFEIIREFDLYKSEIDWELPIKYSNNEYLSELEFSKGILKRPDFLYEFLGGIQFKGKGRIYRLRNLLFPQYDLESYNKKLNVEKIQKGNFDVFHPTYYDNYFLKYLKEKPFVLTVYDMIHEIFPHHFHGTDLTTENKKKLIKKASKIIAISESTKKDIIKFCDVKEEKIEVIYLANSLEPETTLSSQLRINVPEKYILFVGNRGGYKNFKFFVEAIAIFLKEDRTLNLVCTGGEFSQEEIEIFRKYNISSQVFQFYVNDKTLAYFYKKSLFFIFPSLYEGFGIPVLEAFKCGCPVLLSNTSSLPEVGGDAALYFNPYERASISDAVSKVIYDANLRTDLSNKGYQQLKKFTWTDSARKTLDVYKSVI